MKIHSTVIAQFFPVPLFYASSGLPVSLVHSDGVNIPSSSLWNLISLFSSAFLPSIQRVPRYSAEKTGPPQKAIGALSHLLEGGAETAGDLTPCHHSAHFTDGLPRNSR